jgi:hypothetical protein
VIFPKYISLATDAENQIDAKKGQMRTTLELDDVLLATVKRMATSQRKSAGQIVNALLQAALRTETPPDDGTGLPIMPIQPGAGVATLESVNALRDEM